MSRLQGPDRSDHAARRLIDAFLLDELDEGGARELAEHVRGCPECAAELGGTTRLLELLRTLPEPTAAPDLDTRILAAVLADRQRREENRSWLVNLPRQVFRGAVRTTGTLVVTVVTVALIGGAFVFAASAIIAPTAPQTGGGGSLPPVATPTVAPTETTRSAVPLGTPEAPARTVVPATPVATRPVLVTIQPTQEATASPVPSTAPTPVVTAPITVSPTQQTAPTPSASASPSVTPSPVVTPAPTPKPTPEPTARPTPEPTATPAPTPSATAEPSATPSPTPSASDTPTPTPDVSATPKPRRTPPPTPEPTVAPSVTPTPSAAVAPSTSP